MIALVGLSGPAGSGKSLLASMLAARGFVEAAIAEPIKAGLCAMLGIPRALLEDPVLKELPVEPYGVTPRLLMQTLGTEWGRRFAGEDVWIRRLEARIAQLIRAGRRRIVVPDVRTEPEAAFIRESGGLMVHLRGRGSGAPGGAPGHATERGVALARGDLVIHNGGSAQDLEEQAARIASLFQDGGEAPAGGPVHGRLPWSG